MRSELIFGASAQVPNRFLLAKLLATATRKLHRPGTRIQDTTNDVLARFRRSNPITDVQPVQVSPAPAHRGRRHPENESTSKRSSGRSELIPSGVSSEAGQATEM
jgi:hypothetical protein